MDKKNELLHTGNPPPARKVKEVKAIMINSIISRGII